MSKHENQPADSTLTNVSGYPSVGRMLHLPIDPRNPDVPEQFSRPLLITSVGEHQAVSGFLFLEPGDSYNNHSGPATIFVENETNWHWPNTQQPYTGR